MFKIYYRSLALSLTIATEFMEKEEEVLMRRNCLGLPILLTAKGNSLPGAVPPDDENIVPGLIVSHSLQSS